MIMVIPDLSVPQTQPHSQKSRPPLASVSDRFLSFLLDFLLFSPFITLFTASLVRRAKESFLIHSSMDEALVFSLLIVLIVVFSTSVFQAFFLFYFQATPGQMFSRLRVISFPTGPSRLSLNQCLVRSFLWWTSGLAFFLPFLEILSHPLRRAFYERASDTLVITSKSQFDEGPHILESKFFSSWLRMSFLLLLALTVGAAFKSYRLLLAGEYRKSGDETTVASTCGPQELASFKGLESLDLSFGCHRACVMSM